MLVTLFLNDEKHENLDTYNILDKRPVNSKEALDHCSKRLQCLCVDEAKVDFLSSEKLLNDVHWQISTYLVEKTIPFLSLVLSDLHGRYLNRQQLEIKCLRGTTFIH